MIPHSPPKFCSMGTAIEEVVAVCWLLILLNVKNLFLCVIILCSSAINVTYKKLSCALLQTYLQIVSVLCHCKSFHQTNGIVGQSRSAAAHQIFITVCEGSLSSPYPFPSSVLDVTRVSGEQPQTKQNSQDSVQI